MARPGHTVHAATGAEDQAARQQRPPSAQQAGIHGSIGDVNHKVQAVHDAYTQTNGTPPPTGLVFDIIRSPVPPERYPDLFGFPGTQQAAGLVAQHANQNPEDDRTKSTRTRTSSCHSTRSSRTLERSRYRTTRRSPPRSSCPPPPSTAASPPKTSAASVSPQPFRVTRTTSRRSNWLKTKYPQLAMGTLPFVTQAGTLGVTGPELLLARSCHKTRTRTRRSTPP